MTTRRRWLVTCALGAMIVVASRPLRAEVLAGPLGSTGVSTLIMGVIGDDPDPIGVAAWQPFHSLPDEQILNPDGFARGDGRPDFAWRADGWPVAAWAYNTDLDRDIAVSEWTGAGWSTIEFLTSGTDDELDPRVFVESDGTLHVAWWTDGIANRVFLATRSAGSSTWGVPVEVAANGRRPSVAVVDGVLRAAFERDSVEPGMAQDVVVARLEPQGTFSQEFAASTIRTERLDPLLHAVEGRWWMDWKHDVGAFGCSEYGPSGWGSVTLPGWSDPSWVGVEETRRVIQGQVAGN